MKLLHRYVLWQLLRNIGLCLAVVVFLFVVFDFLDRIDNIMAESPSVWLVIQYFLYKIPLTVSLMLPVATMAAVLLTIGVLSKNSEITAMRASGVTVRWIATPVFVSAFFLSLAAMLLNETIVPYTQRRSREIYNIDIRGKDKTGSYSQADFWWRGSGLFYSAGAFDSRSNTLHDLSIFDVSDDFKVKTRTEARRASWVHQVLGWNMEYVTTYQFNPDDTQGVIRARARPLPILDKPADFYDAKTDPYTMSYRELRKFIKKQVNNGLDVAGYRAYLYEKFSSPFITFIVSLVVLPFALKPARSGSMTASIIAAMLIGFSYYAIHSFSLALGRAEFMPPAMAAWMANIVMGFAGSVLVLGAEAP